MKPLRPILFLFALPAAFAGLAPTVFAYDRGAILRGEWWRLWTGHWVHFSTSHACWNLAVLTVAGVGLERLRPGLLARYVLLAAPLTSVGLLALAPAMEIYGGLSGLATGVLVLLALARSESCPAERGWCVALLGLVAGKILWDAGPTTALFSRFDSGGYQVSALAHALGAGLALPFFLSRRLRFRRPLVGTAP